MRARSIAEPEWFWDAVVTFLDLRFEKPYERVLDTPGDVVTRGAMLVGAHEAGIAIEQSMLGATHACANPLTAHYGVTHGTAVGIMLPHVIRFNAAAVEEQGAATNEIARNAPYTTPVRRLDEVKATRKPVVRQPL